MAVFLSYSAEDHHFAELADIKLREHDIHVWRDRGHIHPGNEWRREIETGIEQSLCCLVALSPNSAQSAYVTFEWAFALGAKKLVLPLLLAKAPIHLHPRLEAVHYFNFSNPGMYPWDQLAEEILGIEIEDTQAKKGVAAAAREQGSSVILEPDDPTAKRILNYLDKRGYQMASVERLQRRVDENLTFEQVREIIARYPTVFRFAELAGGKPGIAKKIP